MDLAYAALLGILEGLTEFIPVSSTGHLILTIDALGFEAPPGKVFETFIQLGAILAVLYAYRYRCYKLATQLHREPRERQFARNVILAVLPALVIGFFAHDFIKEVLFSPRVVAWALVVGGVMILLIERYKPEATVLSPESMTARTALAIGFLQCLAMIPGVSRSGATIMGALMCRVERTVATEFSFFLAIPTMLAATSYDLLKNHELLDRGDALLLGVGFFGAFFTALLVVRGLVAFVSRRGFAPFAYYRIALGSLMLLYYAA